MRIIQRAIRTPPLCAAAAAAPTSLFRASRTHTDPGQRLKDNRMCLWTPPVPNSAQSFKSPKPWTLKSEEKIIKQTSETFTKGAKSV